MLSFTLQIPPRSVQFGNRLGRSTAGRPIVYKDKNKVAYQTAIAMLARGHAPKTPFAGPLGLSLTFLFPPVGKTPPGGFGWHSKRPDADNLAKGTTDGMAKSGFWTDDAQIALLVIQKAFSSDAGNARIVVTVWELSRYIG